MPRVPGGLRSMGCAPPALPGASPGWALLAVCLSVQICQMGSQPSPRDRRGRKGPWFITDKRAACQAWGPGRREARARATRLCAVRPHLVPCPVLALTGTLTGWGLAPGEQGPTPGPSTTGSEMKGLGLEGRCQILTSQGCPGWPGGPRWPYLLGTVSSCLLPSTRPGLPAGPFLSPSSSWLWGGVH